MTTATDFAEYMRINGGATLSADSPYARHVAFAKLVSCDERDGYCVLAISGERTAYNFASLAKHAGSWRPRVTNEDGQPAGYATGVVHDSARQLLTLDCQIMDRNVLTKLSQGVLTGLLIPLRITGQAGDRPTIAPSGPPRFTDRPVAIGDTFRNVDAGGTLKKRKFASAVRGGSGDPMRESLALIKQAQSTPRPYGPGTLANAQVDGSAQPDDATLRAIKQAHRR